MADRNQPESRGRPNILAKNADMYSAIPRLEGSIEDIPPQIMYHDGRFSDLLAAVGVLWFRQFFKMLRRDFDV